MKTSLKVAIIASIFVHFSCQVSSYKIIVVPQKGICINNDSVVLGNTTIKKLLEITHQKDTFSLTSKAFSQMDINTALVTPIDGYKKNVLFKGIDFEYEGLNKDSLKLSLITIKETSNLDVFIHDSIRLGQTNPQIYKIYHTSSDGLMYSQDSLTFDFFNLGIGFKFVKLNQDKILSEVFIHNPKISLAEY